MSVYLAVSIDVDSDNITTTGDRSARTWNSLSVLEPLADLLRDSDIIATWFVRADFQIRHAFGSSTGLLDDQASLWRDLQMRGHEIGWHPHVYTRHDPTGQFVPDYSRETGCLQLCETHQDIVQAGWSPQSVRIGEAFQSLDFLATLDALQLSVDSSALPGRYRQDAQRSFDWRGTPNQPYRPSRRDYRIAGLNESDAFRIVEVPMTTMLVEAPYDCEPALRYINLAYHHETFTSALSRHIFPEPKRSTPLVITTIVHPDELVARSTAHGLYAFSLSAARANLRALWNFARSRDDDVQWKTIATIGREYGEIPC